MRLPVHQVRKSQRRPTQLCIQPNAEVMQRDLGCQTSLKPAELMGSLPVQTKGMKELVVDRFDDLTEPCQPAAKGLRPRGLAIALRRTDDLGPVHLPVWLNNGIASRRFPIIVAEQPTEALPTDHPACLVTNGPRWLNQLIAKPLMIPLGMIMR